MADLRGKRLLVTGGSNIAKDIFAFTKPRGIQVIATGNSHNPLMDQADECYSVNTQDVEALKTLCREAKIDGVFAGGNEPNIVTAIQVTQALGMPYYCTMEQWEQLMNKDRFKKLCRQFRVPVTPEYEISNEQEALAAEITYPVVVKPVDSCGSNGVIYCENRDEMITSVREALGFSTNGRVIVEKYVLGDEINAVYTICHGQITILILKWRSAKSSTNAICKEIEYYE